MFGDVGNVNHGMGKPIDLAIIISKRAKPHPDSQSAKGPETTSVYTINAIPTKTHA